MTADHLMHAMRFALDYLYWCEDSQDLEDYDLVVKAGLVPEETMFKFINKSTGWSWSMHVQ